MDSRNVGTNAIAHETTFDMPAAVTSDNFRFHCLIEGESAVFSIQVPRNMRVEHAKEGIKLRRLTLNAIDPYTLELWKVDVDLRPYKKDQHSLGRLKSEENGEFLASWESMSEYWTDQPPSEHLHLIVKVPATQSFTLPSTLGKRPQVSAGETDLLELQEKQAKRYRSGETPSAICKDAKLMKSQQDTAEILNGRPWTRSGPPVGLYHPVFDRFLEYFNETPVYRTASSTNLDDSTPSIDDVFRFMRASSAFYDVEQSLRVDEDPPSGRVEAVLPDLSRLLGISLLHVKNADGTEPNVRATARTPGGGNAPVTVAEFKLESGISGDAKTQVQQSYARTCSLPEHKHIRLRSCSPCFLVEIAGPWITVLGAVFVQKVIVQHLVAPIYLPPQLLHPVNTTDIPLRLFHALRRAIQDLCRYYEDLPRQMTLAGFFPCVRSYTLPTGGTMDLDYVSLLSDESKAVYIATADGRQVVVKFALTYNAFAHRLLADNGLAPELIYDGTRGPRYGGLLMFIMDYVEGRTLSRFLHSSPSPDDRDAVIKSVKKAISLLHAKNLVFGDLRTPNILVDEDGGVKLVDCDWCGVHEKDHYPFIVGDAIEWVSGIGPCAIMHKNHDLGMLAKLEAHMQAGDLPGFW